MDQNGWKWVCLFVCSESPNKSVCSWTGLLFYFLLAVKLERNCILLLSRSRVSYEIWWRKSNKILYRYKKSSRTKTVWISWKDVECGNANSATYRHKRVQKNVPPTHTFKKPTFFAVCSSVTVLSYSLHENYWILSDRNS